MYKSQHALHHLKYQDPCPLVSYYYYYEVNIQSSSSSHIEISTSGWGSLPVQSVQEMVWKDPTTIPDRYIREKHDRPKDELCQHSSDAIPVMEFALL